MFERRAKQSTKSTRSNKTHRGRGRGAKKKTTNVSTVRNLVLCMLLLLFRFVFWAFSPSHVCKEKKSWHSAFLVCSFSNQNKEDSNDETNSSWRTQSKDQNIENTRNGVSQSKNSVRETTTVIVTSPRRSKTHLHHFKPSTTRLKDSQQKQKLITIAEEKESSRLTEISMTARSSRALTTRAVVPTDKIDVENIPALLHLPLKCSDGNVPPGSILKAFLFSTEDAVAKFCKALLQTLDSAIYNLPLQCECLELVQFIFDLQGKINNFVDDDNKTQKSRRNNQNKKYRDRDNNGDDWERLWKNSSFQINLAYHLDGIGMVHRVMKLLATFPKQYRLHRTGIVILYRFANIQPILRRSLMDNTNPSSNLYPITLLQASMKEFPQKVDIQVVAVKIFLRFVSLWPNPGFSAALIKTSGLLQTLADANDSVPHCPKALQSIRAINKKLFWHLCANMCESILLEANGTKGVLV